MAIAEFEDRPIDDIIRDVSGHYADLISVRVIHADVEGGTIPANDGVRLNQYARDLMTSAALSLEKKRRHFRGTRSATTTAFVETLRLRQTERGSYIVNIIAPLPREVADQPPLEHVPITSAVTANLTAGLTALNHAIDEFEVSGARAGFDMAMVEGASANMCDALVGLSGIEKKRSFEISITPSRAGGSPASPATFVFSTQRVARLVEASAYYKQDYVVTSKVVQGFIKRLDRAQGDEHGTIWVEAMVDGVGKQVAIDLGPEDYVDAIMAHRRNDIVRCSGDVHVTPRTAKLINPTGFQVVLGVGDLFQDNP